MPSLRPFLCLAVLVSVVCCAPSAGCQKQESLDGTVAAGAKSRDDATAFQKETDQRVKEGEALLSDKR
jgi:hypothetical protein